MVDISCAIAVLAVVLIIVCVARSRCGAEGLHCDCARRNAGLRAFADYASDDNTSRLAVSDDNTPHASASDGNDDGAVAGGDESESLHMRVRPRRSRGALRVTPRAVSGKGAGVSASVRIDARSFASCDSRFRGLMPRERCMTTEFNPFWAPYGSAGALVATSDSPYIDVPISRMVGDHVPLE